MVVRFATTYSINVYITTKIVNSIPAHGEVYSIQHYVIKLVSYLRQPGRWFSPGTLASSTNKTERYDITEKLLKMALKSINQTKPKPTSF